MKITQKINVDGVDERSNRPETSGEAQKLQLALDQVLEMRKEMEDRADAADGFVAEIENLYLDLLRHVLKLSQLQSSTLLSRLEILQAHQTPQKEKKLEINFDELEINTAELELFLKATKRCLANCEYGGAEYQKYVKRAINPAEEQISRWKTFTEERKKPEGLPTRFEEQTWLSARYNPLLDKELMAKHEKGGDCDIPGLNTEFRAVEAVADSRAAYSRVHINEEYHWGFAQKKAAGGQVDNHHIIVVEVDYTPAPKPGSRTQPEKIKCALRLHSWRNSLHLDGYGESTRPSEFSVPVYQRLVVPGVENDNIAQARDTAGIIGMERARFLREVLSHHTLQENDERWLHGVEYSYGAVLEPDTSKSYDPKLPFNANCRIRKGGVCWTFLEDWSRVEEEEIRAIVQKHGPSSGAHPLNYWRDRKFTNSAKVEWIPTMVKFNMFDSPSERELREVREGRVTVGQSHIMTEKEVENLKQAETYFRRYRECEFLCVVELRRVYWSVYLKRISSALQSRLSAQIES